MKVTRTFLALSTFFLLGNAIPLVDFESQEILDIETADRINGPEKVRDAGSAVSEDNHQSDDDAHALSLEARVPPPLSPWAVLEDVVLTELLDSGVEVINQRDHKGRTALHDAAWDGRHEWVVELLKRGADINAQDFKGRTPLHLAAGRGRSDVVVVLVENGANVTEQDNDGKTALQLAAGYPMMWNPWE
jgi:ankyrin repeat protein